MSKFDDDTRQDIQNAFAYLNVPDEDDFAAFIQAIADGIEYHEHTQWGGPGSGTGDAALLTPDLGPGGTLSDEAVDNIDTWKKLLPSHPYLATEGLPKVWLMPSAKSNCYALTCDAPHMYAGLSTTPAQVAKIDIADMIALQTWIGDEGEGCCQALVFDGAFLYAGLATDPARVIKINPNTMAQVDIWEGEAGQDNAACLTYDGTHLYVGLYTDPAKIIKVYPRTMRTHEVWETAPGWEGCQALTFDGEHIYAGLATDPAKVIKVNPATMETVTVWVGDASQRDVRALAFDTSYIYAGLHTKAAQVIKIDPRDMTEVDLWLGYSGQDYCQALVFDGELIHAVLGVTPTKLISIDTTTMAAVRARTVDVENGNPTPHAITFDGLHLCLTAQEAPLLLVHISYHDYDNESLKYAHWDGTVWQVETVDSTGDVGEDTSIALDSQGYPHISYKDQTWGDEKLKYAYKDASGWHIETIDTSLSYWGVGTWKEGLALDADDYPHIVYYDKTNDDLRYAYKDGSGWHTEVIDANGDFYCSIVLDDDGYPHVGYLYAGDGVIKYAYKDSEGWHTETAADYNKPSVLTPGTSIKLDSSGYPHIAFTWLEVVGRSNWVKYAWKDDLGWHDEAVGEDRSSGPCLELDTDDYPHISYFGFDGGNLRYAYKNRSGWHKETADTVGYCGLDSSMELGSDGHPRISHYDLSNGNLRYAIKSEAGWSAEVVDEGDNGSEDVGEYTSLALGAHQ